MLDDDAIRKMINSIDIEMPDGGLAPPDLEAIGKEKTVVKKRSNKKLFVQKLVTEIYIYTDLDGHGVGEVVGQQMYLLGNMSESKLRRLIDTERRLHEEAEEEG